MTDFEKPISLGDGQSVEVMGDLEGVGANARPVAVLFVASLYNVGEREEIQLPGLTVALTAQDYLLRANVTLQPSQARELIRHLEYAIRDYNPDTLPPALAWACYGCGNLRNLDGFPNPCECGHRVLITVGASDQHPGGILTPLEPPE